MTISSLTSALRIGISGMQVSQMALGTVSHNVVNANTDGFSRQIIQTSATSSSGYGNGVQLSNIQRVSDKFLVARTLTTASDAAYASAKSTYLQSLEDSFSSANASGGLESVVGTFVTSLNSLANDPSNSSLRRAAVQQGNVLAGAIKSTNQDLTIAAGDADAAITANLNTTNGLLKDIYLLNQQIANQQAVGNGANNNDLLDSRSVKVAQLAENFGLQVSVDGSSNSIRITTENGRKLVDENGYVQLSRGANIGNYQSIVARNVQQDGSLSTTELPIDSDELTTGKLKALTEIRDTIIPNMLAQLNEFTDTFAGEVNRLASQGTSSPPVRTLTSGSTATLSATGTDLLTNADFSAINGTTINISVTNSLGNVVTTTVGTPITLAPINPATTLSLANIATIINTSAIGNATMGGTAGVIATATTDSNGNPILTITSANSSNKVVMSNVTGDALGLLGMNNLFTGTDSSDIAVRSDILANADLIPVAQMRADGGVSNTDNKNILGLSALADKKLTFASAGGLGTQTNTAVGYLNTVTSNLAVAVSSAKDNDTFASNMLTQAQEAATSVSGVNINEELAQMLVYQNSFQASSRIISVINDMLQELVNIV